MRKNNIDSPMCDDYKKPLMACMASVLAILFLALTVSTFVDIISKIKQSRYIGQDIQSRNTIIVSDSGEVFSKPDLALIDLSVIDEADTVSEAMAENTQKMNEVIRVVKEEGVEEKDLKTTSFNVYPRYEYVDSNGSRDKRVLAGYEVRQTLQVKIRSLDSIGQIIESAAEAGANDVGSLQLVIENEDELKKQAREQAIEKAKNKAKELASQLGVRIGNITSFSENWYFPYYDSAMMYKSEEGYGGAAPLVPSIESGENKISVSVVITYEIY